jgi:hypothetical protein
MIMTRPMISPLSPSAVAGRSEFSHSVVRCLIDGQAGFDFLRQAVNCEQLGLDVQGTLTPICSD